MENGRVTIPFSECSERNASGRVSYRGGFASGGVLSIAVALQRAVGAAAAPAAELLRGLDRQRDRQSTPEPPRAPQSLPEAPKTSPQNTPEPPQSLQRLPKPPEQPRELPRASQSFPKPPKAPQNFPRLHSRTSQSYPGPHAAPSRPVRVAGRLAGRFAAKVAARRAIWGVPAMAVALQPPAAATVAEPAAAARSQLQPALQRERPPPAAKPPRQLTHPDGRSPTIRFAKPKRRKGSQNLSP